MTFHSIYILIDPRNNHVRYVGKSKVYKERMKQHLRPSSLKARTHKNAWLKQLLNEGHQPIREIIDIVPENEWQFWEKHYICLYRSWGFNLTNQAEGGLGNITLRTPEFMAKIKATKIKNGTWRKSHTEETKKLIGEQSKGRIPTVETRDKRKATIASWDKEKIEDYNQRRTIKSSQRFTEWSKNHRGKTLEEIYGVEKAAAMKEKSLTNLLLQNEKRKLKVQQLTLGLEPIKVWNSMSEIQKTLGIRASGICLCCKGKYKQANGYIWRYFE